MIFHTMRYHHRKRQVYSSNYGFIFECDHPVYNRCTLYKLGNLGLAVIQQRYDPKRKTTWWTEIDEELVDELYLQPRFYEYFKSKAGNLKDGCYPTITLRQLMWGLRMKPLKREPWETVFDKSPF